MGITNADIVSRFADGCTRKATRNIFIDGDELLSYGHHFTQAIRRRDGTFLINADKYSVSTSRHTGLCIQHLQPNYQIPFSALAGAGVFPEAVPIEFLDKEEDGYETVEYVDPESGELKTRTIHHLANTLFRVFEVARYFLSGFDANDDGWRSYFLCELPFPVHSIADALESLKPREVLEAEKLQRLVERQGEWFFIPTLKKTRSLYEIAGGKLAAFGPRLSHQAHLRTDGEFLYARGNVHHRPRFRDPTHKRLSLEKGTWYRIVRNTALGSWEATGNVD